MMQQQPPDWAKRSLEWLSRQPRWLLAVGAIAVIVLISLFSGSLYEPTLAQTANGTAAVNDPTALTWGVFIRMILVVIAIFIAVSLFRRWQSGTLKRVDRRLEMLETLQINPRRAIHLVRAGEQVYLIGSTDQSVSLIGQVSSLKDGEMRTEPGKEDLSFSDHLSMAEALRSQTPEHPSK